MGRDDQLLVCVPQEGVLVAPQEKDCYRSSDLAELPADTAGGEEEPVHEDPGAVVVGVEGEEPVPLVLLLAGTVSVTPSSRLAPAEIVTHCTALGVLLPAYLLVDRLLEVLVVEDGPDLAVAVAGPERRDDLDGGPTDVLLAAGVVDVCLTREVRLTPGSVVTTVLLHRPVQQLLQGPLQHVSPEPLLLTVGPHHPH